MKKLANSLGCAYDSIPTRKVWEDALAKGKSCPTYDVFEWDDIEAGKKLRDIQARSLMSHIGVEVVTEKGTTEQIRFFKHIEVELESPERVRGYVTIDTVHEEAALLSYIKADLRKRLLGIRNEIRKFGPEFEGIIAAIDLYEEET